MFTEIKPYSKRFLFIRLNYKFTDLDGKNVDNLGCQHRKGLDMGALGGEGVWKGKEKLDCKERWEWIKGKEGLKKSGRSEGKKREGGKKKGKGIKN